MNNDFPSTVNPVLKGKFDIRYFLKSMTLP
ncbi:MAG: hypothetical protein ACI9VN_002862 [Patescibacteria group bacterium]|jgi:hypothetical protein